MSKHTHKFFKDFKKVIDDINLVNISSLANNLRIIRNKKGRVFFLGVGGSAGNCSHAVNDFRKLCGIECYCITDNVSELTARINDEGWNSSFSEWLKISNLNSKDAIFIMSVGGGNIKKKVSTNIVEAIKFAKKKKSLILGIVGHDGGFTLEKGDCVVRVPVINKQLITPYTEAFHSIVWHCLVSDPLLQIKKTKW